MRKWLRYIVWGILVVLPIDAATIAWLDYAERKEREETKSVEAWLHATIFPKLEPHHEALPGALAYINKLIEAQPNHPSGLRLTIATDAESKKAVLRKTDPSSRSSDLTRSDPLTQPVWPPPDQPITASLTMRIMDTLRLH